MTNPENYLDPFIKAGADSITIHAEIEGDVAGILKDIRARGCKAGVSVKPGTPVEQIFDLLPLCDLVLLMTVEPGFGGQKIKTEALKKARTLRTQGYTGVISADGGLSPDNAHFAIQEGVNRLVMGTALFKADDPHAAIQKTREAAR
jgi:ribulose-phosphate 3-epimerase